MGIIKCLKCNDTIESKHRHDFKSCECGQCFVDGGEDYFRYGAVDASQIEIVKPNAADAAGGPQASI